VKLSRRELLASAAGAALGAAGVYELVERYAVEPQRAAAASTIRHLPEQHIVQDLRVLVDDGVEVFEPPLHHQLVTAKLLVDRNPKALAEARAELEQRLAKIDAEYPATPAGVAVTVAWGLPYFERYVPGQARRHLPVDRRASADTGKTVSALLPAQRFPSDPSTTILERNDLVLLVRSDSRDRVQAVSQAILDKSGGLFRLTSIRRGFVGGGFNGGVSLPKRMAVAAGVSGADLIPDRAELFLGFTSTQAHQKGRDRIANFETLGLTDVGPSGYFAHGTHMHVSHLFEDLEGWYLNFTHQQRVDTMFRPGLTIRPDTLTVRQDARDAQTAAEVVRDYNRVQTIGHSGSMQPVARLLRDVRGPDGVLYHKGTPIPHRADFNTLDNPFSWSADPVGDGQQGTAAAGLHFVVFNPSSDDFRRGRLAMDGHLPGHTLQFTPGSRGQGFNAVLQTTHRQNFLVPPRAHRSFPLSELRA
jgi:hypothetical protein